MGIFSDLFLLSFRIQLYFSFVILNHVFFFFCHPEPRRSGVRDLRTWLVAFAMVLDPSPAGFGMTKGKRARDCRC